MKQIDKLTASSKQKFIIAAETGEDIEIYLQYNPSQESWNISLSYQDFVINGLQLVVGGNILRQYSNVIPFGLAVGSLDGLDPKYITDFVSGRVALILLNEFEIEAIEASLAS